MDRAWDWPGRSGQLGAKGMGSAERRSNARGCGARLGRAEMRTRTYRVRTIGIYKAPPDISREMFETEFKAMVAQFIELPIVQNSLLKHEVCFAREHLDDHARTAGLGVTQTNSTIVAIFEADVYTSFS
ncbi:hypothetical protein FB451DRAFT_1175177 [Mycena latifolia]|nr:hypothetical protein FB451DRAFT_1175177 [Mycena latifolia]